MTLYSRLRAYRVAVGAPWYTDPYDLNAVVLRGPTVGTWDDLGCLAYSDLEGAPRVLVVVTTSDAGMDQWTDPTHPDGCIWIRDGHYPGAWAPGTHRKRRALRQVGEMHYVRWRGSSVPAPGQLNELRGAFWGVRGTHWHDRRDEREPPRPRPGDSEGCVVTMRKADHGRIMALVDLQEQHVGVGIVSPTFAQISKVLA